MARYLKAIMSARQLARLNRRMRPYQFSMIDGVRRPACFGLFQVLRPLTQGGDRLSAVSLTCSHDDGDGPSLTFFARTASAANAIRKHLFRTLPSWPEIGPTFDGVVEAFDSHDPINGFFEYCCTEMSEGAPK